MSLIADGQFALAIVYYHKSLAQSSRQPNMQFVIALKSHDLPSLMATTAAKFGLKGHYIMPDFWAWTSMVYPSVMPMSKDEVMETLLIKTWLGFASALNSLGDRILNHASPRNWKQVFQWGCRFPREVKTDIDGRTNLHLAVLLGLREEVSLLSKNSNLDFWKGDETQRTPLHLAAILGDESICDILLGAKKASDAILVQDAEGRRPLWYAAEAKKQAIFKKLLHATLACMSLSDICSETDKDGGNLVAYCTAHGLAPSELLQLAEYSEFSEQENIRPDLYAGNDQAWQSQMSIISGNALSSWAGV
ncbi:hypothetical protein QQX98_009304 [Neonectria punicea]|uniref:Uncharacterized protein n=1 Tax=Neonectria punicea TaxID=979145 RepID=A0ABR1GSQ0_9HYPO